MEKLFFSVLKFGKVKLTGTRSLLNDNNTYLIFLLDNVVYEMTYACVFDVTTDPTRSPDHVIKSNH